MWATVFALAMAASVSLSMVSFTVQAKREQAILNSIADRATAQVYVEHASPRGDTRNPG
jgi:hypothetical protein